MGSADPAMDARAFALASRLLEVFLTHGLTDHLRKSLTDKQRAQPFEFQCRVLARNVARSFLNDWQRADSRDDSRGGAA